MKKTLSFILLLVALAGLSGAQSAPPTLATVNFRQAAGFNGELMEGFALRAQASTDPVEQEGFVRAAYYFAGRQDYANQLADYFGQP